MTSYVSINTTRLRKLKAAVHSGQVGKELTKPIAERVRELMIDSMSGIYPPASSTGEPPAIRTGSLMRSIQVQAIGNYHIVTIGGPSSPNYVRYAAYLEHGTSRMAPRPFIAPALHEVAIEAGMSFDKLTGVRRVLINHM